MKNPVRRKNRVFIAAKFQQLEWLKNAQEANKCDRKQEEERADQEISNTFVVFNALCGRVIHRTNPMFQKLCLDHR
jgi:hypothetical protein